MAVTKDMVTRISLKPASSEQDKKEEIFKYVKNEAEKGNIIAQHKLGIYFEFGYGTPKNLESAFIWYKSSADQGYALAQYSVAKCFQMEIGTKLNREEASNYFRRAAEQGNGLAMYHMALYSQKGYGNIVVNLKVALEYYLATSGIIPESCLAIGEFYEAGTVVDKDLEASLYWFQKTKELAQTQIRDLKKISDNQNFFLKNINAKIINILTKISEERSHFLKCLKEAENNDPENLYQLAICYHNGIGIKIDKKIAFNYFMQSKEKNHSNACYYVGQYFEYGWVDGNPNMKKAIECYYQVIRDHNPLSIDAILKIADCYRDGYGVEQNPERAFIFYRLAAINYNNDKAQIQVGLFLEHGVCQEKTLDTVSEAISWYRKVSDQEELNLLDNPLDPILIAFKKGILKQVVDRNRAKIKANVFMEKPS
jgi:TPR repeat protein